MSAELTQDMLEELIIAVDNQEGDFVKNVLEDLHPEDITSILYELDTDQCIYVFNVLAEDVCSEILATLDEETRTEFVQKFAPEQLATWVDYMDSDDAADMLQPLSPRFREKTLAFVDTEHASHIADLLNYEEGCAGAIMEKELIKANMNWTVVQAIDEIRRQAENVEKFYSLYVVDDQNLLLGRVSLKKIILSSDQTLIRDIYDDDLVMVKTYYEDTEVAEIMQKYDLEAVPVVNARGELVGRITIDDIVDVITDKADLDRQLMSGITEDVEEDDSILLLTRARLPWLIIGMFGGLMGAQFIGLFEADLVILPAMAFFIPLITATGGNVGIQSSSIVLQSLASKSIILQDSWYNRFFKVLIVAILNGLVISGVVFGFSFYLEGNLKLSITVAVALFSVVLLASLLGTFTPLVLNYFNINPAVASGPFITTANDLLGLAVYFTTARMMY
jgi:magnesium transporter